MKARVHNISGLRSDHRSEGKNFIVVVLEKIE